MSNNRSRLVTGGGSVLKASPTPLVTASATKSGPWLKRKLATPTNSKMHAKPSLLRELNSLAAGVNRTETAKLSVAKFSPGKVPVVKVYDSKASGSVAQKRRSCRKSQGKRRSTSVVTISSAESTILQESVCYEKIENYFENKVPNRSSEKKKHRTRLHQQRMVEPIKPLPSDTSLMEGEGNVEPMPQLAPMLPPVPMSFSHSPAAAGSLSILARSPGVTNSTSISNTIRDGSRRLKPAAKNCPINCC
uniref:Uncharacterized protein n=1 Tax=Anopheles melas TaxID=34690 RepID=A0A182UCJ4_9DIPT